jgi:hypothetical protein
MTHTKIIMMIQMTKKQIGTLMNPIVEWMDAYKYMQQTLSARLWCYLLVESSLLYIGQKHFPSQLPIPLHLFYTCRKNFQFQLLMPYFVCAVIGREKVFKVNPQENEENGEMKKIMAMNYRGVRW